MKKIFSIIVCAALVLVSVPFSAFAQDKTVFYLNFGDVSIGDDLVSGYDIDGNEINTPNENGYVITQSYSAKPVDYSVNVTSGRQKIELLNVNIKRNKVNDYAVSVQNTAGAEITITGENRIESGLYRAGLDINYKASCTINGDGILYATGKLQAGIGGGNGKSNGTLVINSGTIYATGGVEGYSAGIGGGTSGKGGNITINGGYVVANGGTLGSGIGGGNGFSGGNITINGGTVTATGGNYAAGIGGGYTANGGNIVINGGSVKAVAGLNASEIGNGYKCQTEFSGIKNSDGEDVTLKTFVPKKNAVVYFNGIENGRVMPHEGCEELYFYTSSDSLVTEYCDDGNVNFYFGNTLDELSVYLNSERFGEYLVVEKNAGISLHELFTVNDDCLIYNEKTVDSFKTAYFGDIDLNGNFDGMDAVLADCAKNGMITDTFKLKLSDANHDFVLDEDDIGLLLNNGLKITE